MYVSSATSGPAGCCARPLAWRFPGGIFAILSEDAGETWDTEHPVHLATTWDEFCLRRSSRC